MASMCQAPADNAGSMVGSGISTQQSVANDAVRSIDNFSNALKSLITNFPAVNLNLTMGDPSISVVPFDLEPIPDPPDFEVTLPEAPVVGGASVQFQRTVAAPADPGLTPPEVDTSGAPNPFNAGKPPVPSAPREISVPDAPNLTAPTAPSLTSVSVPAAPALSVPAAPTLSAYQLPADPQLTNVGLPSLTPVTVPAPPVLIVPDAPAFLPITLPTAPTINSYVWSELPPDDTLDSPGDGFTYTEADYSELMLTPLVGKLQEIMGGTTGIPDAIWNQIWDRARRNAADTAESAVQQATDEWASRGFSVPGGALLAAVRRARQQATDMDITQFREIAVKQAELVVQQLQFAVQQGVVLESKWVDYWTARGGRLLEAAKYMQEAALGVFNARVNIYNASIQRYKVLADVFKVQVESELSKIELYKGQIEGQKAVAALNSQQVEVYKGQLAGLQAQGDLYKAVVEGSKAVAEVNMQQVEAYKAQVDADSTKIQLYAAQLDGVKTQSTIDSHRVEVYKGQLAGLQSRSDIYRSQVEAAKVADSINLQRIETYNAQIKGVTALAQLYSTRMEGAKQQLEAEKLRIESFLPGVQIYSEQVKAYTAEWEGYRAKMSAEETRVSAFRALVDVFSARVQAYQVGVAADKGVLDAQIATEEFKLKSFMSDLEAYKAEVAVLLDKVKADSAAYGATLQAYSALSSVERDRVQSDSMAYDAEIKRLDVKAQLELKQAEMNMAAAQDGFKAQIEANAANLDAYGKLAQAAWAAVHYSATVSSQAVDSASCSTTYQATV